MRLDRFPIREDDPAPSPRGSLLALRVLLAFPLDHGDVLFGMGGKDGGIGRHGDIFPAEHVG
jgi:hypothetical protein